MSGKRELVTDIGPHFFSTCIIIARFDNVPNIKKNTHDFHSWMDVTEIPLPSQEPRTTSDSRGGKQGELS